jgi:hypothetical protein
MDLFKNRINSIDFMSMSHSELDGLETSIHQALLLEDSCDSSRFLDLKFIYDTIQNVRVAKIDAQFFQIPPSV